MSKAIEIVYRWDRRNFEKLFEASYKYLFTHSAKRYIGWFFVALLQFGVVAALKQGSVALLIFASVMLLYWYYGKKAIAAMRARKSFERSSFKDKTIRIIVNEKGFEIMGNDGKVFWSWDDIDEVIVLDEDMLLYRDPNFYYLPSSGFATIEERSRFKKLAKKYHKLKG